MGGGPTWNVDKYQCQQKHKQILVGPFTFSYTIFINFMVVTHSEKRIYIHMWVGFVGAKTEKLSNCIINWGYIDIYNKIVFFFILSANISEVISDKGPSVNTSSFFCSPRERGGGLDLRKLNTWGKTWGKW